jgi:hypothetical protein
LEKKYCEFSAVKSETVLIIAENKSKGKGKGKGKGKAIPLQALTGPEGSRKLRLPDFKTIGT